MCPLTIECVLLQRLFSFAVCQVLDMPILEQQLMLQMQDTALRLRKQQVCLERFLLPPPPFSFSLSLPPLFPVSYHRSPSAQAAGLFFKKKHTHMNKVRASGIRHLAGARLWHACFFKTRIFFSLHILLSPPFPFVAPPCHVCRLCVLCVRASSCSWQVLLLVSESPSL